MGWLGSAPKSIRDILITHKDTDHLGAAEDSPGLSIIKKCCCGMESFSALGISK